MMVLFLTGLVSVILLRTVKRDFTRYDREEGLTDFVSTETKDGAPPLFFTEKFLDIGQRFGR